jgi:cytochrome d ubiquinol oxidase subunit I
MQNPVGYEILANGKFVLTNFSALFTNPWLWPSYLHNQAASLVFCCSRCIFLSKRNEDYGKMFLKLFLVNIKSNCCSAYRRFSEKNVVKYQPVTFAAMEGIFIPKKKEPKLF